MIKISAMLGILCAAFTGLSANGFKVSANGGLDCGKFKTGPVMGLTGAPLWGGIFGDVVRVTVGYYRDSN